MSENSSLLPLTAGQGSEGVDLGEREVVRDQEPILNEIQGLWWDYCVSRGIHDDFGRNDQINKYNSRRYVP
jgi:hypothetical protein